MDLRRQVNDWRVAGAAQVGGAAGVGGGVYWFSFHSETLGGTEAFMFTGLGVGAGGSIGGAALDPSAAEPIVCNRPFSVFDLDGSGGRVTYAGASFMVGYSLLYISGFNLSGSLFSSQAVHGYSAGVGLNAIALVGSWRSSTLAGQDAARAGRSYMQGQSSRAGSR